MLCLRIQNTRSGTLFLTRRWKSVANFGMAVFMMVFRVSVQPFLTGNDAIPHFKKTHELLKTFSNARPRQIENSADLRYLQEKCQMFVRHCNRKAYQIEFVRCRDCNYCNNLPLRENDFLTVMCNFGDTLPVPEASIHKDHYKSLDDMLRMSTSKLASRKRCVNNSTSHGVCLYSSCHYAFFSEADRQCHFNLMGHPNPSRKQTQTKK